jgi:hypothetical protein
MQYTISIAGEELLRFEETWPDNIPYRPVESIEFMYDSASSTAPWPSLIKAISR